MDFASFFFGSIPLLIQFYAEMYYEIDYKNTLTELESEFNVPTIKTYDFIVVGGGSSGCVLAGRLSENFNVLLLEAGGTPPPATIVPIFGDMFISADPDINNFFTSVPQTNASFNNGIVKTSTGKMLGGSASHNGMIHMRGNPRDYDNWATLLNDNSFEYRNLLKYFKKMETFNGPKFGSEGDDYYGHEGPIVINTNDVPMIDLWLEAGRELGYNIGDPNGFQREGFVPLNVAIHNGRRSSSYEEYIKPFERSRDTLTIVRYANVSEILLDNERKAYGVAYNRHGFPQIAHAQKEVILSAGAFSSPILLMKSGIGPESILNAAEIPVKVPLEAVGKNLVDHVAFHVTGFSVNDSSSFQRFISSDIESIWEKYHNGNGILTLSWSADAGSSFIVSPKAEPDWPDLLIGMSGGVGVDDEEQRVNFHVVIGRPKSRGFLTLDTEKYKAGIRHDGQLALIDFKLLTHPDDIDALLHGVRHIFKIVETNTLKRINLTYTANPDPACNAFTFLSDDYWKCKIQQTASSWTHMIGTCRMGSNTSDSTTSVVDTNFRVRGVSNLRVVDASVMPEIPNANINAPVMMLAEKAAEEITDFFRVPVSSDTTTTSTSDDRIESTPSAPNGTTSKLLENEMLFLVLLINFIMFCKQIRRI